MPVTPGLADQGRDDGAKAVLAGEQYETRDAHGAQKADIAWPAPADDAALICRQILHFETVVPMVGPGHARPQIQPEMPTETAAVALLVVDLTIPHDGGMLVEQVADDGAPATAVMEHDDPSQAIPSAYCAASDPEEGPEAT